MATKKHIAVFGQDIFDAVLQNYGTLEDGVENFIQNNPTLDLGLDLVSGQEVLVSPEGIGDVNTKEFITINASVMNNADGQFVLDTGDYDFQDNSQYDFQSGDLYDFN